jgi:hypothetical protein
MSRVKLLRITAALGLTFAAGSTSFADLYWGAVNGGDPSTAGSGTWDNSTANWATGSSGPAENTWDGTGAIFQGTGGTVTTGDTLSIGSATFNAGGYTLDNEDQTVSVTGAGLISNVAGTAVTNQSNLNFLNSSSASAGTSPVAISGAGNIQFEDSSNAGTANITTTGNLSFQGTSSAASANITNDGTVDISGLTSSSISMGSLASSSAVLLGNKTLNVVGALSLDGNGGLYNGAEFNFTLGTTSALVNAGSEVNLDAPNTGGGTGEENPASGYQTDIDITAGAGFKDGTYALINVTSGDLSLSDYTLGDSPFDETLVAAGSYLKLGDGGQQLDLVAVPEVSSILIPILGAAGLFWLRRRGAAAMAEMPAMA